MSEISGYILAGGASSRMGADKARLRLGGRTLVERAAEALSEVAGTVSLVSSRPGAEEFGMPVVADIFHGLGALGGLHAALTHATAAWAVVLSCDLPFAGGALLRKLAAERSGDFDAVAPLQEDGRPQPLCALYAPARCLPAAAGLINAGELRPRQLLARVRTRWLAWAELKNLEGSARFFLNVNTPAEFARAERLLDGA